MPTVIRIWGTETFWCVQSMEYIVYHYDHDGNLLDSLLIAPPHYRPLSSREPVDVRSGKHSTWRESWDWLGGISTVNDTLLAVTLTATTRGPKTDIIDARDGTVLTTYHFGWGNQSIAEADPVSLRLLLRNRSDPRRWIDICGVAAHFRHKQKRGVIGCGTHKDSRSWLPEKYVKGSAGQQFWEYRADVRVRTATNRAL